MAVRRAIMPWALSSSDLRQPVAKRDPALCVQSATPRSWVTRTTVRPLRRLSDWKQRHDLAPVAVIEVAGRLVGQQQARIVDQGAGDGDALLLPAGQLGWAGGRARSARPDLSSACAAPARGARRAADAGVDQRQLDILQRGVCGSRLKLWKTKPSLAVANLASCGSGQPPDLLAVQQVLARRWACRGSRGCSSGWTCPSRMAPSRRRSRPLDPQADAPERVDRLPGHAVLLGKIDRFQKGAHVPAPPEAARRPMTTCCPSVSVPPVISVKAVSAMPVVTGTAVNVPLVPSPYTSP